ncbi:hypothetical protein DVH24_038804 [Malus domestica]|uniref:Phosphoribosyl-AMP cyclohydrolase domain-containing protein n=1 Tax=Malus domestica TaxID=3750 RepID=A0A498K8E5_MALDO|nr:hypothetical protein DVH24_038804 [Malus domestica]
MAIPHLHFVQSVRVSSPCRISFPNQYHYGGSNFSRKSSSLVYASTHNFDRDLHLQSKVETVLDNVKWDDKGLAVAIAQNVDTGAILMQGFANREAVAMTVSSRKATFYSRSRSTLWTKGETSNNFINVQEIFLDCDRDSYHYGRSNFSRKSSSLIYASTSNFDRDLHLQLKVETVLDSVKWDDKGLAVAIAQNVDTEAILMQGFANREAVATTISSRKATFYSRSRSTLWTKGETSNNFINVQEIFLDCDRDSIIYLGKPDGPTWHTGSETCYYTPVLDLLEHRQDEEHKLALTTLVDNCQRNEELEVLESGKPSWTRRLLSDEKEEADELCQTLEENEDRLCAASEMAYVLYHGMALLGSKGVKMEEVLEILRHRFSQSGIEEKRNRKSQA